MAHVQCQEFPCSFTMVDLTQDSVRMEAGFRKYFHREVDHKRLAEKEKKKKKKEMPGRVVI